MQLSGTDTQIHGRKGHRRRQPKSHRDGGREGAQGPLDKTWAHSGAFTAAHRWSFVVFVTTVHCRAEGLRTTACKKCSLCCTAGVVPFNPITGRGWHLKGADQFKKQKCRALLCTAGNLSSTAALRCVVLLQSAAPTRCVPLSPDVCSWAFSCFHCSTCDITHQCAPKWACPCPVTPKRALLSVDPEKTQALSACSMQPRSPPRPAGQPVFHHLTSGWVLDSPADTNQCHKGCPLTRGWSLRKAVIPHAGGEEVGGGGGG